MDTLSVTASKSCRSTVRPVGHTSDRPANLNFRLPLVFCFHYITIFGMLVDFRFIPISNNKLSLHSLGNSSPSNLRDPDIQVVICAVSRLITKLLVMQCTPYPVKPSQSQQILMALAALTDSHILHSFHIPIDRHTLENYFLAEQQLDLLNICLPLDTAIQHYPHHSTHNNVAHIGANSL